ncbi:hypothetical protein [Pseudobacteriovorax antillogorgiicola]|uniref:Ig-like domain-containing protein n=1 Tax=Pseudobacteriovorax antillogorgiicola TaxID=1513793 RepID=A0A1Y6B9W3_9BACT|nr:hypothetical protein [Pseudobacteriovorax antillogorgiicola]TCS58907.1 hypothetical protein EDD56_102422 [Pseudobacteriovorax antillogorgiicola]SME93307.1 hypothetical protein SAMN06296036_10221 [Pseudobacteriovorax antillogorgiicola]
MTNLKTIVGQILMAAALTGLFGAPASYGMDNQPAVDEVKIEKSFNRIVCSVGSIYSPDQDNPTLLYQFYRKGKLVRNIKSHDIAKYIAIHISENENDYDCKVKVL